MKASESSWYSSGVMEAAEALWEAPPAMSDSGVGGLGFSVSGWRPFRGAGEVWKERIENGWDLKVCGGDERVGIEVKVVGVRRISLFVELEVGREGRVLWRREER